MIRKVKRLMYPTAAELSFTWRVLNAAIPMDEPPVGRWRTSDAGAPNLRIASTTRGREWSVDCYNGYYFCVKMYGQQEVCQNVYSLVHMLCRMLRVSPKKKR